MPEPRALTYHRNRIAEALRDEIGAMLEGELTDPRIGFCYVTEVILQPGGKSARIFVAVDGDEKEEEATLEGLMAAKGHIRHSLLERLGVRRVPDLSFQVDRSNKSTSRVEELLARMKKRQKKTDAARKEPSEIAEPGTTTPS